MLRLKNINYSYGDKKILNNFNLEVKNGEFLLVIGKNGAGKSTLFNIISGSLKPLSGSIEIDGKNVTKLNDLERSKIISKVMQDTKIGSITNMSIEENLSLAYMRGKSRKFGLLKKKARIDLFKEKLSLLQMDLENRMSDSVANLSGGQRQALSILMSVLCDSKVLLLDEVTAALDMKNSEIVIDVINKLAKEKTTLMISHNPEHKSLASSMLVL